MSQKYYNLKIKEVVKETDDTVTLHFKQPLFKKIAYQSGQFLTLITHINDKKYRRSYSLCSTPNIDSTLAVTVKRVEGGVVSNFVNDKIKAGDKLEIMEPMGTFVFEPKPNLSRHIVLWGGGSGITPLMSILKSVLHYEAQSIVTLIYSNRDENSIIFKSELEDLQAKHGDRFQLIHFLSQAKTDQIADYKTRISSAHIPELLDKIPKKEDTLHYLCGPEGLMHEVRSGLEAQGVPAAKILQESFYTADADKSESDNNSTETREVEIRLDGESHKINVGPEQTVLDVALDAGIDMPYSCQSGLCTACRGKCLSGHTEMDMNDALSEVELKEGYVLTCQLHPLSDDVVIDMDE
ncbi:MAG: ferredoxin--NADP reductase [Bernardetiaceae bacterium]|nr:ferredoxin--NADP reductase [Bernardetiaceae bacterium]